MSVDSSVVVHHPHVAIRPDEAQAAAEPVVNAALGFVKSIIPPPKEMPMVVENNEIPMTFSIPSPARVTSSPVLFQSHARRDSNSSIPQSNSMSAIPAYGEDDRRSTFLPSSLASVPEEMWSPEAAEDFLMNLIDEDWAIGEGVDMELLPSLP